MRRVWIAVTLGLVGCATAAAPTRTAPQPSAGARARTTTGEHEPEIVKTGKIYKLGLAAASARYPQGARCSGADAPEAQIGEPDQRNEMQVGRDRVATYGFRFAEGTLMLRCRGERVELARVLK